MGNGEGLGDVDHVNLKLGHAPHFWNLAAIANTVGHEFGHMMLARLMHIDNRLYGWSSPDREHVNFVHYADRLAHLQGDSQYVDSRWITDWRKARILRVAVFDVERLWQDRDYILSFVAANKHDRRWAFE